MATKKPTPVHVDDSLAVVKLGSQQFLIKVGDVFETEKIEAKPGEVISASEVLLYHDDKKTLVGTPIVENVKVKLEHLETAKAEKIRVARYRAKSRYRKVKGHRQLKTKLKVISIELK